MNYFQAYRDTLTRARFTGWLTVELALALMVGLFSLSLVFYPEPFRLSISYSAMAAWGSASDWGLTGLLTTALHLLWLPTRFISLGFALLTLFLSTVAINFIVTVGFSPVAMFFTAATLSSYYTLYASGGWGSRARG